jgi:hypothetical protein
VAQYQRDFTDISHVAYHVYWTCVGKENQERVTRSNFENAALRLYSQRIVVSVAPSQARSAASAKAMPNFTPGTERSSTVLMKPRSRDGSGGDCRAGGSE